MKKILAIALLTLAACRATPSATDKAVEVVQKQVEVVETQIKAVKQTLPTECKTPAVLAQIDGVEKTLSSIRSSSNAVAAACVAEKQTLQAKIDTRDARIALLVMALLIVVVIKLR